MKGEVLKYYFFFIPLALIVTACGGNGSSAQKIPSAPSKPIIDGAPIVNTLQPMLHGSCDGNTVISLYVDGRPVTPAAICDNGTYAIMPASELTHGRHCFSVLATDGGGVDSEMSDRTCVFTGKPFITVWKTDNEGITEENQIRLTPETYNYNYNYAVDWGDGTSDVNVTEGIVHTYPSPGMYTVKINGYFPKFSVLSDNEDFGDVFEYSDRKKLIALTQWGSMPWRSMTYALYACINLDVNASDSPNLADVTDLRGMFAGVGFLPNLDMSGWDVSNITNMEYMLDDSNLSTQNYGKLLRGWGTQTLKSGVVFDAGNSRYSSTAEADRQKLIDTFGWTINDGGMTE